MIDMKKIVSLLCIAVILVMMSGLAACGEPKLDGTYLLVEMASGGQDLSDLLDDIDICLTVKDDHATLTFADQTTEWEIDTKNSVMRNEEGAESPYRTEDNLIILENEEDGLTHRMVFEKAESTPDTK